MPPKNTTELLKQLRQHMKDPKYVSAPLTAYIVPSGDAHNSEYLADCDMRRAFISGFTGSAGTAIVTIDSALMWTDGRYFLQASEEMDPNWKLMKEGLAETPTQSAWLSKNLPIGSTIGVDPKLVSYNKWTPLSTQLEAAGHKLLSVPINLVDLVWSDKPKRPYNAVNVLPIKFAGRCARDKLTDVRKQMDDKKTDILVVTALDEIAWLLNLRGSDITYNPVFFAYVIITTTDVHLFIDNTQLNDAVKMYLTNENVNIKFHSYESIVDVLKALIERSTSYAWLSDSTNYALTSVVPIKSLLSEITPLPLMKAVKNTIEVSGMKNAHVKDAAALCCYFAWLEKEVPNGTVTEVSAAQKLHELRTLQDDYIGPSFATISSVGPHGAVIHYQPSPSTDVPLTIDALYLCDSGGQYRDGTTDVTRTVHFGTPTQYEKECFTRVLKGQMFMGSAKFPMKIRGNCLDTLARKYLWDVGLDYLHGTGHGIGSYLNVHEGPMGISWRVIPDDPGLEPNMFLSNEPGYYEDGKFGIRIEDIVQVVPVTTKYNFNNKEFLAMETITLMPKQIKMIVVDMLTDEEINDLNEYHQKCWTIVGALLKEQNHADGLDWLKRETVLIKK